MAWRFSCHERRPTSNVFDVDQRFLRCVIRRGGKTARTALWARLGRAIAVEHSRLTLLDRRPIELIDTARAALPRAFGLGTARLAIAFVAAVIVSKLLGLTGVARGVLVLQGAMPAAVLNYLFAVRYGNDPQDVAAIVVISTVMSVLALPLFLLTVM